MPSATDFLPSYMTEFMNLETTRLPYLASGLISRFSAEWRRDMTVDPYFGRLAPYFERRCLRFLTPCVSSTTRRMWEPTPGRSFTRPPRIITTECSWRL